MSTAPKRPSGGKRATEAKRKRREQAARTAAAVESGALPVSVSFGNAPTDPRHTADWILLSLVGLAVEAKNDPGLTPPQQRREAGEHLARAAKAIDAAKLRVELDELLARLSETDDGAQEHRGEDRGSEAPTRQ